MTAPLAGANPWLRVSPCAPEACVEPPVAAAGPLRRAVRLAAAAMVLLAGIPLSLAARGMRTARRGRIVNVWARMLLRALGVRLDVRSGFAFVAGSPLTRTGVGEPAGPEDGAGPEERRGTLVVANHVSWLDPLVVAATVPSRPLAKREVGAWPVIRTLAAGSGALFIDRERLSALPEVVGNITGALRAGDTVAAFPEGTTWCGRGMGEFRPAVFQAAIDARAAVRPVTLRYREGEATSTRGCYVGDDSLLASILRVVATRSLVVEVTRFPEVRLASSRTPSRTLSSTWSGMRHEERGALARIAEAYVRTGLPEQHGAARRETPARSARAGVTVLSSPLGSV
ncbi:lysophospholipid acyltransferase family protein [Microtetraspora sp. NBRC 16547]|uniref:lysophospholipid acyltransferase family protein n=1 Tax=Microtetraspora sp. NBRC 16547 TaxID=3030993 RepID=UPI0024A4B852|nr:lysophospholipid acyltransferase family protein [Microtetraspora sp. NBRC 16547]GLW98332.1 1-acyl-sn-glycerol-3-phosphate acyltransferase [Microtetraspora sp. NBRC 16547]